MAYTESPLLWKDYNLTVDPESPQYPSTEVLPLPRFQFGLHVFEVWLSSPAGQSDKRTWKLTRGIFCVFFVFLMFFLYIMKVSPFATN